jgi:hypothetical protein
MTERVLTAEMADPNLKERRSLEEFSDEDAVLLMD